MPYCRPDGLMRKKNKLFDYTHLTDDQLIKRGAHAERNNICRAYNPLIYRQARLWTYGWNTQHGECVGCWKCHYVGTLQMPPTHFQYLKICAQTEKELNAMTYEDLILAHVAAARAKESVLRKEAQEKRIAQRVDIVADEVNDFKQLRYKRMLDEKDN
tara:strand:+ start:1144 stop:1617 length:474 start_codon:yes stop_codon:yes gene_type:complete